MANQKKSEKRTGRLFFTGFSMGVADLIPGVSSGTIAFLCGIYEELLYTIKLLTGEVPRLLVKRQFRQAFSIIPFHFLVPLGIGMLIAIFSTVQLVSYLLDVHPVYIWSVFFGLVLGSSLVISQRMNGWNVRRVLLFSAGFLAVFFIVGLPGSDAGSAAPLATLGSGAVASAAMIIPGISGTLVLVLLGQYERIIAAIADFDIATLAIFAAGIVIGLSTFARLVSWLLHNHHGAVIATLIGAMLGSLRAIWPWQADSANVLPPVDWALLLAVVLMVVGLLLVLLLQRIGIAQEHVDIDAPEFKRDLKTQKD